ncbi:hypothetical protein AGABI2DRAFT_116607 [Agaricus bisporus var. bisporus H97]|uniref:hypothetical protein n=1 Tax=Agaricus bisporus var. bisporus (strain H97 / ATCC MYA-4626 / FGSC 10389) TaxID=936046 RepID=UPI00029F7026|nr:hypothetical protein AGABI2DRAFT_116607 [Agaricus bisporus var. bisporus H97]EKV49573.1 hypothetical protein AGABI2DRAFT_116607 [Agaricus bisporus var. bisporus H97]
MRFFKYEVSLHTLCRYTNPSEILKPVGQSALKVHGSEIKGFMQNALLTFYYTPDPGSHLEWTLFRHFNFGCLAHSQSTLNCANILLFVERLYAWGKDNAPNIVRVKPSGPLDSQFIEKCEGLAEPFDLEVKGKWWALRLTGPKYVLLGHEAGVLVVLATDSVPGVELKDFRCYIYTSAMLEYM